MSCTDTNPLLREGTSQQSRVLAALSVHYADVDERTSSDLILFAKRYAKYLNFYNESNIADGNWQPLMMMDISVTLATLASINIRKINDYKKLLYKNISLTTNLVQPDSDNKAKQALKFLFDTLFSLIKNVDDQLQLLPDDDYKTIIGNIIKSKLKLNAANLQHFFEQLTTLHLLHYTTTELDSNAPVETVSNGSFNLATLSDIWQPVVHDLDITIPSLTNDDEKIVYIINHNLFTNTVDAIIRGISLIVNKANDLFQTTLTDFPQHTPHYALFLTFTKLFKAAQDELNHYTQHHLDFYYKDVLQLNNKDPQPDSAHLTFGLQKASQQQLLTAGTLFKGGKDITGKDINYSLTEDVVLNRATVVAQQAQQIDLLNNTPLKTYLVANSEDGEGAKLLSADKSWDTFGNPKTVATALSGFAIASNIFFLNEGERTITVIATFQANSNELLSISGKNIGCFEASLTGKKDWLYKNVSALYNAASKTLTFTITLSPNDPAIIPYSEKIHKQNFATVLPLLQIYLDQDAADAIPYSILCKQVITHIDIEISVEGVKDLILSSDTGVIDASKPFKPFGDFPDTTSSFYIGSKEIFQKKISELTFNFSGTNPFTTSTYYLGEATWKPLAPLSGNKITGINIELAGIDFTANENLKATTLNGFIKLTNTTDKSINTYLKEIKTALDGTTLHLVDASKPLDYQLTVGQLPAPEEIKISNFFIDYKATSSINFTVKQTDETNNFFYQITPFGFAGIYNDGIPINSSAEKTEKYTLVPDINNNGELFIGFDNAEPGSVVTVLFQVADGSSNPLKDKETVYWFYLVNNVWIQFDSKDVTDRTNDFTQSGIVTITLPGDITNENTLFQKGLYWVKAAIETNIDAVCRMIAIQAQAALVKLVQDETNGIEFRQIIPANSISKLVISNAAIKTITQPFDGFGGRTRETDDHFYVRVSERLRHKQRAISIWDYEHILLEQFPQLYKVKCINHSGFYEDAGTNVWCENFAGHVTIIPIPDLKNNTHINLLKPYTPISLLNGINGYLIKLTSPFVKLHVKNPQFEEIRLDFKVSFYDGLDESYYKQLLNIEIEKFLSPWAFNTNADIPFGSKIIKSVLLNFVEERPYVDFVTCFEMHHILRNGETIIFNKNVEEAIPTTSRSILVSYYDEVSGDRHIINSPATCNC